MRLRFLGRAAKGAQPLPLMRTHKDLGIPRVHQQVKIVENDANEVHQDCESSEEKVSLCGSVV